MRKVILYGELGKRFGKEHEFEVRSASEAIQAMCVNFPGFKTLLQTAHKYGVGFKVFVGKSSLKKAEDALLPSSKTDDIRIAPALFGSGGDVKIIIGAVLTAAGAVVAGAGGFVTAGALVPVGQAMMAAGIGLMLNGVFELLAPAPKTPTTGGLTEESRSFIFSGPENVSRQGGAVPIGYGRMMVGSTVISAGIEDTDQ